MKLRLFAAAAVLASTAALALPALASTSISLSNIGVPGVPLPAGEHMVADFNEGANQLPDYLQNAYPTLDPNFTLSLGNATVDYMENTSGYSGGLPNDTAHYLTVIPGVTATIAIKTGYMNAFSFYMGSPDWYNTITLHGVGGYTETLTGTQLTAASPGGTTQEWSWGKRIDLGFDHQITSIDFTTGDIAFEVDNFAASARGVPEPASWALMLVGFGGMGAALRSRRRQQAAVA